MSPLPSSSVGRFILPPVPCHPCVLLQPTQKKSCPEGAEPEQELEGDGEKKGNAEGSSDEEGKLVIDEQTKEKNEKAGIKRKAEDALEVAGAGEAPSAVPRDGVGCRSETDQGMVTVLSGTRSPGIKIGARP